VAEFWKAHSDSYLYQMNVFCLRLCQDQGT